MSGLTGFLSVNRNVRSADVGPREFRLPRMNPFPKLDRRAVRASAPATTVATRNAPPRCALTVIADIGPLPEMTTDVMDASVNCPASNVKRADARTRGPWSRCGLGQLVGRMLSGR
jgi:hypothetical protein